MRDYGDSNGNWSEAANILFSIIFDRDKHIKEPASNDYNAFSNMP